MTIYEFLYARLHEIELYLRDVESTDQVLFHTSKALLQSQREVLELWNNWPVLVESKPKVSAVDDFDVFNYVNTVAYQMSAEIQWLTTQEYIKVFGRDPAPAPFIKNLLKSYRHHPDFQEEWL